MKFGCKGMVTFATALILTTGIPHYEPVSSEECQSFFLRFQSLIALILKHHNTARIASYPNLISFWIVGNADWA